MISYTPSIPCDPPPSVQDIHSQGEVIACLEKGLVREAEEQPGAHSIKEDCKKAIMRVAELSSDDFHLDRYLYFACREDRERFCENVMTFDIFSGLIRLSIENIYFIYYIWFELQFFSACTFECFC